MRNALVVVMSSPTSPETDKEFTTWYDVHLEEILALPKVVNANRFEIVPTVEIYPRATGVDQPYLAIFELDGGTREVCEEFTAGLLAGIKAGQVTVSPSMDRDQLRFVFALPSGPDLRA